MNAVLFNLMTVDRVVYRSSTGMPGGSFDPSDERYNTALVSYYINEKSGSSVSYTVAFPKEYWLQKSEDIFPFTFRPEAVRMPPISEQLVCVSVYVGLTNDEVERDTERERTFIGPIDMDVYYGPMRDFHAFLHSSLNLGIVFQEEFGRNPEKETEWVRLTLTLAPDKLNSLFALDFADGKTRTISLFDGLKSTPLPFFTSTTAPTAVFTEETSVPPKLTQITPS